MIEAGLWGLFAASSLVLGALIAFAVDLPARVRGWILAFGAGALFGAVAYELVADSIESSEGGLDLALGFAAGALTFYVGSVLIDRMSGGGGDAGGGATDAARSGARRSARTNGQAIVLGAVLDGIPESLVLGLSLIGGAGVGIPVLVAVFVSNIPEALSASEDLASAGMTKIRVIGLWVVVAVASGLAAAIGFALFADAGTFWVVVIQSFAAGAILAMLAESMIPEANEIGGRAVGLATCLGFALSTWLSYAT